MSRDPDVNVVGGELLSCSTEPLTGFFRDGCCATGPEDVGSHTVCAVMTEEFLEFSRAAGNDLSTPVPEWGFPGLAAGRPLVRVRVALAGGARGRRRTAGRARRDARAGARGRSGRGADRPRHRARRCLDLRPAFPSRFSGSVEKPLTGGCSRRGDGSGPQGALRGRGARARRRSDRGQPAHPRRRAPSRRVQRARGRHRCVGGGSARGVRARPPASRRRASRRQTVWSWPRGSETTTRRWD